MDFEMVSKPIVMQKMPAPSLDNNRIIKVIGL